VKRAKPVEKVAVEKPFSVQMRDMWRKNKFACVSLAILAFSWLAVEWFNRNRAVASWASSQGLSYSGSYDYKFAKRQVYFDALSRGTRQYAFNVMKGMHEYQNLSTTEAEKTNVQAFDFCYTEVKTYQQNKRVHRVEKHHEFSALIFAASDYKFRTLIVTPRDMVVDGEDAEMRMQQADADTEELLKKKKKKKKKKTDDAANSTNATDNATNATSGKAEAVVAAEASDNATTINATTINANATLEEDTHPLSFKFNSTFKVLSQDHTQAAAMLTPALKQLLLDNPKFILEFQEDQIMVYKEFTIEPQEYTDGLKLGAQILGQLPSQVPNTATQKDTDIDVSVFFSRTEAANETQK